MVASRARAAADDPLGSPLPSLIVRQPLSADVWSGLQARANLLMSGYLLRLRASLMMLMMAGETNVRPVDGPAVTDRNKH